MSTLFYLAVICLSVSFALYRAGKIRQAHGICPTPSKLAAGVSGIFGTAFAFGCIAELMLF